MKRTNPAEIRALVEVALTNKRATIRRYANTGHPQEIRILEQAKGAEEAYHAVLEALQGNRVYLKLDAS